VDAFGNAYSPICNHNDVNGPPDDASCAPPARINENYGSMRGMFYEGQSYYNALEAQLAKRMSHGFSGARHLHVGPQHRHQFSDGCRRRIR